MSERVNQKVRVSNSFLTVWPQTHTDQVDNLASYVSTAISQLAPAIHNHHADHINEGVLDVDRIPPLPQSKITNLTTDLAGKLGVSGKAADSDKLDGLDSTDFGRVMPTGTWHSFTDPLTDTSGFIDGSWTNKFEFFPFNNILQETSTNGNTFITTTEYSEAQFKNLLGGDNGTGMAIPNMGGIGTRWKRFTFTASPYVSLSLLYFYVTRVTGTLEVKVERFLHSTSTWELVNDYTSIGSWPAHCTLRHPTIWFHPSTHYSKVRVTFMGTTTNADHPNHSIMRMQWWGGYPAGKRNVFSTDSDRNVSFPAGLNANGQAVVLNNDGRLIDTQNTAGGGQSADKFFLVGRSAQSTGVTNTNVDVFMKAGRIFASTFAGSETAGVGVTIRGTTNNESPGNITMIGANIAITGTSLKFNATDVSLAGHAHNAFTGATGSANGVAGFVRQPLIANQYHYLRGDGVWIDTPNTNWYLTSISKSGNTLTFNVQGSSNPTFEFGSNAFTSYTDHTQAGYLTSMSAHDHDRLLLTDSRGAARLPNWYDQRYAQWDFQNSADTGAGGDGWHGLLTVAKWTNYHVSHRQEQIAFTGQVLKRRTAISDTSWGDWHTFWDTNNLSETSVTNIGHAYNHSQEVTGNQHGATNLGSSLLRMANPNAETYIRINPANTISLLNKADFRASIGAGTGNSNLELGSASNQAHRGDHGALAYNHIGSQHAPIDAQKNSDITKAEIEARLTGTITTHEHAGHTVTVLGNRLTVDSDGKIRANNTNNRRAGMYGIYDSVRVGHIWSMGSAYQIPANGANFGNLYGLAYKHTNNTTGGTMAGGHQMVWAINGTGTAAMGTNIWTSGQILEGSNRVYSAGNNNIGSGPTNYAAGNDARLSDARNVNSTGNQSSLRFWSGTQAEYTALGTYDNNRIYLIEE